ncbi:MAG: hypothetical protein PUH90_01960 [Clostridia bacterium]|nr:hypothetical protein [Clostridia bacterium]MDY2714939.1 hypothetical protein [Christensenellaceae bacterium]MDY3724410.1 hypothetical protein [Christensenellaceae bacterium]
MREIKVTESASRLKDIDYVARGVSGAINDLCGVAHTEKFGDRAIFTVKCAAEYADYFKAEIEDRIADVIAVKYKYAYFKKFVRSIGLNDFETELLRAALISADLDEDKKYIVRRIRGYEEYAVDGIYNFRLEPLKRKWSDIVGYIPSFFTRGQLKDFVSYLLGEKRGKKVFVNENGVYDSNYSKLDRVSLTGGDDEGRIVREVLLSASGSVSVKTALPQLDEKYIKLFYGAHAVFG